MQVRTSSERIIRAFARAIKVLAERPKLVRPTSASAAMAALLCQLLREPPGKEKEQLDEFLLQHGQRYDFSGASALKPAHESFGMVFQLLVQERFLSQANWERLQPRDCQLRVLQCMRVLMRDNSHRTLFAELGGVSKLVGLFGQLADEHFQGQAEFGSEMLVETLSILKRFATHESADEYRLQRTLVALLSTREVRRTPTHRDWPAGGLSVARGRLRTRRTGLVLATLLSGVQAVVSPHCCAGACAAVRARGHVSVCATRSPLAGHRSARLFGDPAPHPDGLWPLL